MLCSGSGVASDGVGGRRRGCTRASPSPATPPISLVLPHVPGRAATPRTGQFVDLKHALRACFRCCVQGVASHLTAWEEGGEGAREPRPPPPRLRSRSFCPMCQAGPRLLVPVSS